MPAESSTVTVLVLDVFAFLAVLAYASFEARHRSRKQHGALIKTDEKPHQNSIKPKPEAPNMGCQGNLEDGPASTNWRLRHRCPDQATGSSGRR